MAVVLGGCNATEAPFQVATSNGWVAVADDTNRPANVRTCPSEVPELQPALAGVRAALATMDYAGRKEAVDALATASKAYPAEAEAHLLLGLAELWTLAEPAKDVDLATLGAAAFRSKQELEKAYELCPTDHRIPAWLGPIDARIGETLKDPKLFDEGLAILDKGIAEYPSFVLFSRVLVYANRPKTDPAFTQAVDAVLANIHACEAGPASDAGFNLKLDPACNNSPHAFHNLEGGSLFLGDVLAKAGRRAEALRIYTLAKLAPNVADWNWQALLTERIDGIDVRIGSYDGKGPTDEAWNRTDQCSLCHRQ